MNLESQLGVGSWDLDQALAWSRLEVESWVKVWLGLEFGSGSRVSGPRSGSHLDSNMGLALGLSRGIKWMGWVKIENLKIG